ncbi:hypothetical protein K440DRAFT_575470 [Wilcoxina mikolae CBS 423.85]|nr:hypothetical protein K440DRAFT_575470 [Wilcoxina mikolae CBS 423.85]
MPRQQSLHLDLGAVAGAHEELPPLAALFLIHFDTKKGYTIEWARTCDGVDLDGVEFKSLPSGLHNLQEDLVYFVHGAYAGVSAFVNVKAGEEERGALMVSAGVLVPLSYGRLGRSWRHAENLKGLARRYTMEPTTHKPFEDYYEEFKPRDNNIDNAIEDAQSPTSINDPKNLGHTRTRSVSETRTFVVPGQTLSQFHPALSLGEFMDTFGPLVFPIYRAALARKRILLVGHAPVEMACNFVYDISILSNIPLSVADLLPTEPSRLKPLFNIGVHDIPLLETEAKIRAETENPPDAEHGAWVACTTDEILSMKRNLWDVIIHLPPPHAKQAKEKVWPTVETNQGLPIKATQRDLRRFRALVKSLKNRYRRKQSLFLDTEDDELGQPIICAPGQIDTDTEEPGNIESLCEKLTWREMAYSGFMWWASAGEQQHHDAEAEDGRLLLDTHFTYTPTVADHNTSWSDSDNDDDVSPFAATSSSTSPPTASHRLSSRRRRRRSVIHRRSTNLRQEGVGSEEMDLIAYFHRMTQRVFSVLVDAVATAEGDDGSEGDEVILVGGEQDTGIHVSLEDVERMGLDRYSESDAEIVAELVGRWWGREVQVEKSRMSCCGVECG